MQKLVLIFLVIVAIAAGRPENAKSASKPEDRQRETKYKIEDPGILDLQHRETIFENGDYRLDGTAILKKDLENRTNPSQIGGRLEYNYKPGKTVIGLEAVKAGRSGTQVGLEATKNVFGDLDVGVNYGQHFGGPGGRSEPSIDGFVRAHS